MKTQTIPTMALKTALVFGCTTDQASEQIKKNIAQLEGQLAKAEASGKKYQGYTAQEYRNIISKTKTRWSL